MDRTEEMAVMFDTDRKLHLTQQTLDIEDLDYPMSGLSSNPSDAEPMIGPRQEATTTGQGIVRTVFDMNLTSGTAPGGSGRCAVIHPLPHGRVSVSKDIKA